MDGDAARHFPGVDDIGAVIVAQNTNDAQRSLNQVMRRACSWLEERGLDLAMKRKEIVLLTQHQVPTIVLVQVGAKTMLTKNAVKYLVVRLDSKLSYLEQIKCAADKAAHNKAHQAYGR